MPNAKCEKCGKTAYPLESLQAMERTYHKGCFKCVVCKMNLNLKNFKGVDGQLYCNVHAPNVKATQVADDLHTQNALNAPKRNVSEGARGVQKGTGDKANYGLDSIATKNALNAPKRVSESIGNAQKGTGDRTNYGLEAQGLQSALNAPKVRAEALGNVQKGTGEAPAAGPVFGYDEGAGYSGGGGGGGGHQASHHEETHHHQAAEPAYQESYEEAAGEEYYEEAYEEGGYEE